MSIARALLLRASRSKWLAEQFRKRAKSGAVTGSDVLDPAGALAGCQVRVKLKLNHECAGVLPSVHHAGTIPPPVVLSHNSAVTVW